MRVTITLAALLIASSAAATVHFAPSLLDLKVGETATVTASFAMLSTMGGGWRFESCDPNIAAANGEVIVLTGSHLGSGKIQVTAWSPGKTMLCMTPGNARVVPLTVTCGPVPDARAASARPSTAPGKPVTLSVLFPPLTNTTYDWYRGTVNDRTTPLSGGTADLIFTPERAGTHRIWVLVSTPCSSSSVEFVAEASTGRRRGVRH